MLNIVSSVLSYPFTQFAFAFVCLALALSGKLSLIAARVVLLVAGALASSALRQAAQNFHLSTKLEITLHLLTWIIIALLFKWINPRPKATLARTDPEQLIPLKEAAATFYGKSRVSGHLGAYVAESWGEKHARFGGKSADDQVLSMNAYAIIRKAPIYGKRSPSNQFEFIDKEIREHLEGLVFQEGMTRARCNLSECQGTFVELSIKKKDLDRLIDNMQKEARK